ncbi:glycosyltransferase family 9 protein [Humisphaera borealis]|uniref:Tetratricopeptide repeat protein n=1 Tax=Humisphaera borealis TaxID=2807512 RepID=A0A7M2X1S1_9BACT|nr:glycosyltransferase family 9 protein [Humisphaera borealis]QOV91688.1 hypothetical protein IPV69_10120 [Humisphaera borealis]
MNQDIASLLLDAQNALRARQPGRAVVLARQALALVPTSGAAVQMLGMALHDAGDIRASIDVLASAIHRLPDPSLAYNCVARCHALLGNADEALRHYNSALRIRPDFALARVNRAMLLLKLGQFREGFLDCEWRWAAQIAIRPEIPRPTWDGSPLNGRGILVHTEQGLGDTIQFCRLLTILQARGGRVVFACQRALQPLLGNIQGVDRWFPIDEPGTIDFDVYTSLLSLPGLLGIDCEKDIPAEVPYVSAEPGRIDRWRPVIEALPGLKVGLAWQGDRTFLDDRFRSIAPDVLRPLAECAGVSWVRLQRLSDADPSPFPMTLLQNADKDAALVDTAAVIASLDLIVTSDSAIAHLAGAMGKPTWLLLPVSSEWRWLSGRADSPWYPTMRLFRQQVLGDWTTVIDEVIRALGTWTHSGRPPAANPTAVRPLVPVSAGELVDRLTILRIKVSRLTDPAARDNVASELALLERIAGDALPASAELATLTSELAATNQQLWDTENDFHTAHANGVDGDPFLNAARGVIQINTRRSDLKRRISLLCGSELIEEKQYGKAGAR